jgi:hypothetical protein
LLALKTQLWIVFPFVYEYFLIISNLMRRLINSGEDNYGLFQLTNHVHVVWIKGCIRKQKGIQFKVVFSKLTIIFTLITFYSKVTVTDKLYHIMLYTSPWLRFELTTSVVIGTDGIGCVNNCYAEHSIEITWSGGRK